MASLSSSRKNPLHERVSSNLESLTRFLVPMLLNPLNTLGQKSSSAPQLQIQLQTESEPEPFAPSFPELASTQPNPALVIDLSQIPLFEEYR